MPESSHEGGHYCMKMKKKGRERERAVQGHKTVSTTVQTTRSNCKSTVSPITETDLCMLCWATETDRILSTYQLPTLSVYGI